MVGQAKPRGRRPKFSMAEVAHIRECVAKGLDTAVIARLFRCSSQTILRANKLVGYNDPAWLHRPAHNLEQDERKELTGK